MSKSISYTNNNNNMTSTQEHSNALSAYFNVSKIYKKRDIQKKTSKIKMVSLNSTPNTLNNKNLHSFCSATINNTYSNEVGKDKKKRSIPMSLSGKSSKRYFSVSQGYPNLSKSFNKKYRISKSVKGNCVNYLEPKNNKYIGIDLNLVSNSSRRKTENIRFFKDDEIYKEKDKFHSLKINIVESKNRVNSSKSGEENESKNNYDKVSSLKNKTKKIELNSSTSSNIRQNSHLENASVNQSTPVSSLHPYEADSSPTNYIKSYSNINNLTYLTYNNSKKCNKNDEEEEKRSVSHFGLNQSEFTYLNNSNKVSEKEEEKKVLDKKEKHNKIRKNKKSKKKRKIDCVSNDSNFNNENININDSYFCSNNINNDLQKTIEEKEEEYINSMNNKLKISKEKEDNEPLEELIKKSEDEDTIYHMKKTEENERDEIDKEEKKLIKELEEEREKNRIEEERIKLLRKEKEKKEKKENEIKEIKDKIKAEKILRQNLEKKAKILEMKIKNQEIKSLYEEEDKNKNKSIEIKDTNFMNNVNQVTFNAPKSTINAKLNFNYFSSYNNMNEKNENNTFINPINLEGKNILKDESSSSYFYDYSSNSVINKNIFYENSKNKSGYYNDNNKIEKQNFIIKRNVSYNKNNPERQFELEIKPKEQKKKNTNNNNTFSSFNFGLIQKDNSNNKRTLLKKSLMNSNINIIKINDEQKPHISLSNNNISENKKEIKKNESTKEVSTRYNQSQNLFDRNNKSNLFLNNYMRNSGNSNPLKTEFRNEFLNKTKSILFDFEEFKNNYKLIINKEKENKNIQNIGKNIETKRNINNTFNIPHHNTIGRNKGTIWKEYSINNSNYSKNEITEEPYGYSINRQNRNKFNRKINTFVFPANPFDSVNKAREYYFFNN